MDSFDVIGFVIDNYFDIVSCIDVALFIRQSSVQLMYEELHFFP